MNKSTISLRRSQLGTPANEWELIKETIHSRTDEVFLDLEDSLAPSEKRPARQTLIDAIDAYDWSSMELSYRINAVNTRWWYEDVITVVNEVGSHIDNIIVPKVTDSADVQTVVNLLRQVQVNAGLDIGSINVSVQIENAISMNNVSEIVHSSDQLSAVIFGPADYAMSIGATGQPSTRSSDQPEQYWQYPLSRLSHSASSANLLTIGGPYVDVDDMDGFRNWCEYERRLGYDGKLVLTQAQAQTANEVFTPNLEEAKRAQQIVDQYESTKSQAVASIDGNVIDRETYRMAKQILTKAEKGGVL